MEPITVGTIVSFFTWLPKYLFRLIRVGVREVKVLKREEALKSREAEIEWLEQIASNQRRNIGNFIYPRYDRIFLSSSVEIAIVIEWFNGTVFDIDFVSVNGEVKMDGISLGHQITLAGKATCSAGHHCTCTCHIQIDSGLMQKVNKAINEAKQLNWESSLTWEVRTPIRDKPFDIQGPTGAKLIMPTRG